MMRFGHRRGSAGLKRSDLPQPQPRRSKVRRDLVLLFSTVLLSPVIFVGGRMLLLVLRAKP